MAAHINSLMHSDLELNIYCILDFDASSCLKRPQDDLVPFYYAALWLWRNPFGNPIKSLVVIATVAPSQGKLSSITASIYSCVVLLSQSWLYFKFVYKDFTFASCRKKSQQFFNLLSGNDDEGSDVSWGSGSNRGNKNCQLPQKRLQSRRGVKGGGVSRREGGRR